MNDSEKKAVLDNIYNAFPKMGLAEFLDSICREIATLRQENQELKAALGVRTNGQQVVSPVAREFSDSETPFTQTSLHQR